MDEQREARTVDWGDVLGGVVGGWILCWAVYTVFGFASYANAGDSWRAGLTVWGSLAFTPLVLLGVVLVRRQRGQLVAGVLLGLTIGAILGAGVCTTFNLVNMV
jgi:hypothetical protein